MHGRMIYLVVVASLFSGSSGLWAEDQPVPLEMILFESMVEVASQEAEPLKESPVISNVVTADEIKRLGARTLQDVLLTLPGFSHVQDHNEYYGAERGIYASAQQKILVRKWLQNVGRKNITLN